MNANTTTGKRERYITAVDWCGSVGMTVMLAVFFAQFYWSRAAWDAHKGISFLREPHSTTVIVLKMMKATFLAASTQELLLTWLLPLVLGLCIGGLLFVPLLSSDYDIARVDAGKKSVMPHLQVSCYIGAIVLAVISLYFLDAILY